MNSKTVWRSIQDNSVEVESSDQCRALAEKNPTESKYREWVQVLLIQDENNVK